MCTYSSECADFCLVPPLVSPTNPVGRYCDDPSICTPFLPRCHKEACYTPAPRCCYVRQCDHHGNCCYHVASRCDHRPHCNRERYCKSHHECCYHSPHRRCDSPCHRCDSPCRRCDSPHRHHCRHDSPCHHHGHSECKRRGRSRHRSPEEDSAPPEKTDCCKPVKTKYVIPCYRYEDGRIVHDLYDVTRHGPLPLSVFKRNGLQDTIFGYRGAQHFVCAGEGCKGKFVLRADEPLRRLFRHVTQEMYPVKRKKEKK